MSPSQAWHSAFHFIWQSGRRRRGLALAFVLAGLGLRVFAGLAEQLRGGALSPVDRLILDAIRPHHVPLLDGIARGLSALLTWPYVLLLALPSLIYLIRLKRYRVAVTLVVASLGTTAAVDLLKWLFHRDRPLTAIVASTGYSFPSGHATGATVLYGLLGYVGWRFVATRRWGRAAFAVVACLLIVGTGLSRVYLEVHYPSDVLAGWAAGACILFGSLIAFEAWPPARRTGDPGSGNRALSQ